MGSWDKGKIGSVAKLIGGYAFKSGDFVADGVPVIKIKNIEDKNLSLADTDYLPETFLDIADKYKVLFGDILISMTGSHITMPNSAVGRVARSRLYKVLLLNQRVGKFQVNEKVCDKDFLYYCTISPEFREQIGLRSRGAANQANVSGGDIEGIEIPLPLLPIQKKIAGILSAYDDLIENNLKRIKLLEEMAQITYEEWFVRLRFPGHETTPANSGTGLPEGWRKVKLGYVLEFIKRGVAPKYVEEGGVTVINQKCIRDRRVNLSLARQTSKDKKIPADKFVKHADILVNSTGTGTLGRVSQYFGSNDFCTVDTHVTIARGNTSVISPYVLGRFLEHVEPFIVNLGKGATNQQELSGSDMCVAIKINLPPIELQHKYEATAKPIYEEINNLQKQNGFLQEARDILLPRLMTGMIDVEHYNPTDLLKEAA
jgi:type I restriction enzyme, S subunit